MPEQFGLYQSIAVITAGLLLSGLLYVVYRRLTAGMQKRKVARAVKRISASYLRNVYIDLGDEQYAHFDYILLNRQGIVVLDVKDYAGHIFGSEQINEWTQVTAGKSYKFPNPIFEIERKMDLLNQIIGHQQLHARVLFTDYADFPKGRPDKVILLRELAAVFGKTRLADIPAPEQNAWQQLQGQFSALSDS